jgi:hypothetical protein
MFCFKDIANPKAKFCNQAHKMSYRRGKKYVGETVTVIKEIVTDNRNKPEIIVTEVRTVTDKVLRFSSTMPIKERIEKYKEMYPESGFIPNWVAHGFLSKEDAIKNAISAVNKNDAVLSTGLNI